MIHRILRDNYGRGPKHQCEAVNEYLKDKVIIDDMLYESLLEDSKMLEALQGAGVDSWSGYDHALDEYHDG